MKRQRKNLSHGVEHQTKMYALAASAAGVGMLALAQPSQAKIVYTPANIQINVGGGLVYLDLNNDGVNDFQFYDVFSVQLRGASDAHSFSYLTVAPVQKSNRVYAVKSNGGLCAAALPKGVKVGPHSPFQPGDSNLGMAFQSNSGGASCPWRPVMQAYLGVKFVVNGKTHYGWARIKRITSKYAGFPAVITGYAYETIPNKPIIAGKIHAVDDIEQPAAASLTSPAPKPASLGALATGSLGLSIWRRKDSALESE
jgi:hypothetical protein